MNKEKGMVFTAKSVQAILAGTKSQTRRIVKYRGKDRKKYPVPFTAEFTDVKYGRYTFETADDIYSIKPDCQIGDIIYVQETWCKYGDLDNNDQMIAGTEKYYYAADNPKFPYNQFLRDDGTFKDYPAWKSPRYMLKEAARIFLRVTDVRVERLQQISEADAIAEGMDSVESYRKHWGEINGKREKGAYKWENNPFVWMYSFEMVGEQDAD